MTLALAALLVTAQTPAAPPTKVAGSIARLFGPGARVDTLRVDTVSVLLDGFSPLISPVSLRGACDGKPTPAPHRKPFDSVTSAGLPLSATPP